MTHEDEDRIKDLIEDAFKDVDIDTVHVHDSPPADRPCFTGFDFRECFEHCGNCGWDIGYHCGMEIDGGVMRFDEAVIVDEELDEITSMVSPVNGQTIRRWNIVLMDAQGMLGGVPVAAYVPAMIALQTMYEQKDDE